MLLGHFSSSRKCTCAAGGRGGGASAGACADDVAGSAQQRLRDLLMALRVFDDSCKNLRLRVSFTAVKSLSSNLPAHR